jgi:voltage-gated potassium channel
MNAANTLHARLKGLYEGNSRSATRFRFSLLTFDMITVGYFIISSMVHVNLWILLIDYILAFVLVLDFAVRVWISRDKKRYLLSFGTIIDGIVIVTLLLPLIIDNFAFLRVVRALRLLRSYRVLRDLRKEFPFFAQHEDIIQSVVNLAVFIFFITALVYVLQVHVNENITDYVDALYFTVTTLTTTGFGDITLQGTTGHLLSVVIMVVGVGLFLRLVQTIFQPPKVRHTCPQCGLTRHDPDAVHCKHCGIVLNIKTEGD